MADQTYITATRAPYGATAKAAPWSPAPWSAPGTPWR